MKDKEHIKISVRKNDKNKGILNTIKTEAKKNGYALHYVDEKVNKSKATDIVPHGSTWMKTEGNINMKNRLKNNESVPETPKKKLARDQ